MNKIQITIFERTYTLLTDEESERITKIASLLEERVTEFKNQMKGRPEIEVITLTAFDLLDRVDKDTALFEKNIRELRQLLEETEVKNKQLLIENMNSAESELVQIAVVKEHENNELRTKLHEYEKAFDKHANEAYKSAASEMEEYAAVKIKENEILHDTLNNFEKSFDDYVKTRENEAIRLQKELEDVRDENDELKQRLAALADDGQMTIC